MRESEFGTRKEKERFMGYSHNFRRYKYANGQSIDRLEQHLKYGLLSPKEAQRLGIPYRRNVSTTLTDPLLAGHGFKDPDNIIFLFPMTELNTAIKWPNAISVVFSRTLNVLSWEEMQDHQGNDWPHGSSTYGEVYVLGRIDPSCIQEILLPDPSRKELRVVRELVQKHVPDYANKIVVK